MLCTENPAFSRVVLMMRCRVIYSPGREERCPLNALPCTGALLLFIIYDVEKIVIWISQKNFNGFY